MMFVVTLKIDNECGDIVRQRQKQNNSHHIGLEVPRNGFWKALKPISFLWELF